jgi:class 3 adenylate cyclase
MSFRIKLLLVMMLLVAGVTGATLYVTQQKVQATYLKLSQDQFEAELNYFTMQQEARLKTFKDGCEELAKSAALRDALAGQDARRVYEVYTNSVRQTTLSNNFPRLANQQNARTNRPAARGNPAAGNGLLAGVRLNQTFLVLDSRGDILRPPGSAFTGQTPARKHLEHQLATIQHELDNLEVQPVGYLAWERTNGGSPQLLAVILTKVADPDTKQTLGTLVLGVPFSDTSERPMAQMSQGGIESGIWLENHLYSSTIDEKTRDQFSHAITKQVNADGDPLRDDFNVTLGGVPRRVFFRLLNPNSPFPPAYQVSLYSMVNAIRTQNELRWQIMAFGTAAMGVALVLSLLIAHGLSVPLHELVRGTEAIRGGDFRFQVPVRGRDEVAELAASFNEMAEGLAQKELYRTVLNMVADEKVASALVNGGLALGGEVREISVLFCDIRGFTALTENMPPQEVIAMLNEHMTALTGIVKQHNGVLDKFVGDMLMVIFGAPVSQEHDTLDAARCALEMVRERDRLNAVSQHQLKVGIGIATGNVVAGCMGSSDRLNYTVLGERVNLGSRLCEFAGPGQVVIDQTTVDKLGAAARVKPLPAVGLKGFRENTVPYELLEVIF